MPSLSAIEILATCPEGRGSEASRIFRLCFRLTSLSLKTSRTALARSSAEALISMACSPCHSIRAPVPLKSKRVATSRAVWPIALSTSCRSILLTMSNELSAIWLPPGGFGSAVVPCYSSDRPSAPPTSVATGTADCPSGQWERTVNPSAYAYPGSNPGSATTATAPRPKDAGRCRLPAGGWPGRLYPGRPQFHRHYLARDLRRQGRR